LHPPLPVEQSTSYYSDSLTAGVPVLIEIYVSKTAVVANAQQEPQFP